MRASVSSVGARGEGLDDIGDFAAAIYHGEGDILQDVERAISLFRIAAAAGSLRDVLSLADVWLDRESAVDWGELRRSG